MKNIFNKLMVSAALVFMAASCADDTPLTTLQTVTFPEAISASATTVVLTQPTKNDAVLTISWPQVHFPIDAPVKYALQIDVLADTFGADGWANAKRIEAGEDVLSRSFLGNDLNKIAKDLGLVTDIEGELMVRLIATLDRDTYSEPISIYVTPFTNQVATGEIYMPGGYNDWNLNTAATLHAIDAGIFQGYITFPATATLEFKFTVERNWDQFYGGNSEGLFTEGGNNNLSVPQPGSYQITVNLNTMSYTAIPYSFGIIGTATAGGWNTDTDMTYDYINQKWVFTGPLVPGALKFRLNDAWTVNYGVPNNDGNTMIFDNPGAYTVNEAGNYEVTFAVNPDPSTATYSVTPL